MVLRSSTFRVTIDQHWVKEFCKRHQIRRLALFGSVLRDDFGPSSDVDVLVEFEPVVRIGLIGLGALEQELTDKIGRKADLRTPAELSGYFRQDVLDSAEVLYECR